MYLINLNCTQIFHVLQYYFITVVVHDGRTALKRDQVMTFTSLCCYTAFITSVNEVLFSPLSVIRITQKLLDQFFVKFYGWRDIIQESIKFRGSKSFLFANNSLKNCRRESKVKKTSLFSFLNYKL